MSYRNRKSYWDLQYRQSLRREERNEGLYQWQQRPACERLATEVTGAALAAARCVWYGLRLPVSPEADIQF